MTYKFYFYIDDSDADYNTEFEDKNIKTESIDLPNESAAIMYAAETVADMRDEENDFVDAADAELYLDDVDYRADTGFCIAIQEEKSGNYIYGDISVIDAYLGDVKTDANESVSNSTITESVMKYADVKQFLEDNIDNDNDKIWKFITKSSTYVTDVKDIPNAVEGQRIRYRFSSGRNMDIDVYSDAYQENVFIKIPAELSEDTKKEGNYWVNRGDEGTHGKFRTKKAADAQRKAMFAQGYKTEELNEESDIISDIDDLISDSETFLHQLNRSKADVNVKENLHEDVTPETGFNFVMDCMRDNLTPILQGDNRTWKLEILDKHLDNDPPYINLKITETYEEDPEQDRRIYSWDADDIDIPEQISKLLDKCIKIGDSFNFDTQDLYVDEVVEDDEYGSNKSYRVTLEDYDVKGELSVVEDYYRPADLSFWPGSPAESESHVEDKDFQVIYYYKITEIKE